KHLLAADFFDAGQFPSATFKRTSVASAGEGKLKVRGDPTIKGVTKPVVLHVTLNTPRVHPTAKSGATGYDATATIKRRHSGVDAYVPNVSDVVKLRITTEATAAK